MDFDNVMRPPPPQLSPPLEVLGEPDVGERTIGFDNVIAPYRPPSPSVGQIATGAQGPVLPTPLEWFELAQSGQGPEDYEVSEPAGRGPLGLTFRGRRRADGKPVVVKLINERFMGRPDLLRAMFGDMSKWRGYSHDSLTIALAARVSNNRQIVIFEEAPGRSLSRLLQEHGPLPPGQALRVVFGVTQALAGAQTAGVYHGDVRSAKVYFDGERTALADPGFARASCLVAGFGQLGMSFGNPSYLAPEVLQEGLKEPNAQTDVYALGILFYEMLCGRLPFAGAPRAALREHLTSPLPPPPPGVSFNTTLAALILRMTAKSPGARIPSAKHLLEALTLILRGEPIVFDGPVPRRADPNSQAGAGEKVSYQVWEQQSVSAAQGSQRWNEAKLQAAARVGPEEWSPDMLDEDDSAADKALQAVIAAASKTRTAPAKTGKRGAALLASQGPKKGFPLIPAAVGATLLVVGLGLAFYPWAREAPKARTTSTPPKVSAPLTGPSAKLTEQFNAEAELRERIRQEIAEYGKQAGKHLRRERYAQALSLSDALSEEALASPEGQEQIAAVRGEVESQLNAKFNAARLEIEALLEREDYAAAERAAKAMDAWVLDKTRIESIRLAIEAKRDQRVQEVRELRLRRPLKNVEAARRKLRSTVNGKVLLFKRGGLMVSYPRAGTSLLKDLRVWKGKRKNVLFGKGSKAVRIYATKTPMLLSLRVPLTRLLDVKIGLLTKKKLKDGARFAVFVGARKRNLKSKGVSWGVTPVEMNEAGKVTDVQSMRVPRIPTSTPLELTVRVDGQGKRRMLTSKLESKSRGVERTKPVRFELSKPMRLGSGWSTVTLYVDKVNIHITSLEVRGVVDPRGQR